MGEVIVKAKYRNIIDEYKYENKEINNTPELELDSLIDSGAVISMLPKEAIEKLKLMKGEKLLVELANSQVDELQSYKGLIIEIQGRSSIFDCVEGPAGCEVLIGILVLERLDFLIDPLKQKLVYRSGSQVLPRLKLK